MGMNEGIKTVLFPVKDLDKAKALFTALMGPPQFGDGPPYVGWNVNGQNIGLTVAGDRHGTAGPQCFWQVDDIEASLKALVDAGAEPLQAVRNVGGGRLVASVRDAEGNEIGLAQDTPAS
jgi:predicted enzyme related to lactoylglutathione lyase